MGENSDELTVMSASHSRLATWRRCRLKYHLSYVENISTPASPGQARGKTGHAILERYYRDPERDVAKAISDVWDLHVAEGGTEEDFDDIVESVWRYDRWAKEHDTFEVMETERWFDLNIPGTPGHHLVGIIDGVVKDRGRVWLMEHKFYRQVSTKHLDFDPQVSIYMIAGHLLDLNPVGVIYNLVRTGSGPTAQKEPVVRKHLYRNVEGLQYMLKEIVLQMDEIFEFQNSPNPRIYRNLTKDCSWDCPFGRVCLSLNDSGNAEAVIEAMRRTEGYDHFS